MNRKDITKMLGKTLVQSKFSGMGKYWASEVSIDPLTATGKGGRVDFMQFIPENQYSISGLEKGIFVCYEIKSCREDVFSGNGLNFYGEKNYIVTTMQCYKDILPDLNNGNFMRHLMQTNPESKRNFGIYVAVPVMRDKVDEFEDPTQISEDIQWKLENMIPCNCRNRSKSAIELLFCMVRSGQ